MNKIYLYYTKLPSDLLTSTDFFKEKINLITNNTIINSILKYKRIEDRLLSLSAKLLLKKILSDTNNLSLLETFHYNVYKKPLLSKGFISISHSKFYSAAIFSENIQSGIDIQYKDFSNINNLSKYLEKNFNFNWAKEKFYHYWCRLESLLKAHGTGFLKEYSDIKIEIDYGLIENTKYYFFEFQLQNHLCVISSCKPNCKIIRKKIELSHI